MKVTTICGSLRRDSINAQFLEATMSLAGPNILRCKSVSVGTLPPFNPDTEEEPHSEVDAFCHSIMEADAVIIASPEYARGIPGSLKNALDWTVGRGTFAGKLVAVPNISARSAVAHSALLQVMRTIDASVVAEACVTVPIPGSTITANAILANHQCCAAIRSMWEALIRQRN